MLGHSHALSGLVTGTAAGLLLHMPVEGTGALAALTASWATVPDLDTCGSCAARSLGFLSEAFAWTVGKVARGHRHGTHWNIFSKGAPGGESPEDVSVRIRRVFHKIASMEGDVALFSHGHFLRALTALWLTLPIKEGCHFSLSPASLSILSFEREIPVISLWNASS